MDLLIPSASNPSAAAGLFPRAAIATSDLTPNIKPEMSLFDPHMGDRRAQTPFLPLTNAIPMPACLERCNSTTSQILTTFTNLKKEQISCETKDLTPLRDWTNYCMEKEVCAEKAKNEVKIWMVDVEHLIKMPKKKCEECAKSTKAYPDGCIQAEATITEVAWATETAQCEPKKAAGVKTTGSAAMMALVLAVVGLVLSGV